LKLEKEREDLSLKLQEALGTVDSMRGELSEARRKEQELQETLKDRDRKIYEHLKRIGELEQDHFMASSKLTSNIQDFRDTLNTQQTTI
jgi:predicted nuclease with TOPRIM domain